MEEIIMNLYSSRHFSLIELCVSGKKQTIGSLCFKGLSSHEGSEDELLALEDGVVIAAGRVMSPTSRLHRLGIYVSIRTSRGVTLTYSRLSERRVSVGDRVTAGQVIGLEGSTGSGSGKYLKLECRKNGRMIDAPAYLGIRPIPAEFDLTTISAADIVCELCRLSSDARTAIDSIPGAEYVWNSIYENISLESRMKLGS